MPERSRTIIELCGLPAAGKSSLMSAVREVATANLGTGSEPGKGAQDGDLRSLVGALYGLPLLMAHVTEISAFPPRQISRVFKATRAAVRNRASADESEVSVVDEGIVHYICSMSVPARRPPGDLARIARFISAHVDAVAVVGIDPELALARALQRCAPLTRFRAGQDPELLRRLFRDFDAILDALLAALKRFEVPILRLDGEGSSASNAQHLLAWSKCLKRETHGWRA